MFGFETGTSLVLVPLVGILSCFLFRHFFAPAKTVDLQYGLFHLSLNKLPNESANTPPKTEWLNMGYWKKAPNFPEACRALTLKVMTAAKMKSGDTVLDVGIGTGECLVLLLSDPFVPRPSKLTGITDNSQHCRRVEERLDKIQRTVSESTQVEVNLFATDAIWDGTTEKHPFCPESSPIYFDRILATDCAYHFHTRRKFMTQAFVKLRPGGRLALADIVFSTGTLLTWTTRITTSVIRLMPLHNRISMLEYIEQMQGIGFRDVVCEDVTEEVFPHFIRFLKAQGLAWWLFASILQIYTSSGARFVIVSGEKPL